MAKRLKSGEVVVRPPSDEGNADTCCSPRWQLGSNQHRMTDSSDPELQIAKRMYKLSVNERQEVYEDVHGVSAEIQEDEAFVRAKLDALNTKLSKEKDSADFRKASFLRPAYVDGLKILFLRASRFDPEDAALRLVKHFRIKVFLFGDDMLVKEIRYQDLDEEDFLPLQGSNQYRLSRMKRYVFFMCPRYTKYANPKSYWRAVWFISMIALRKPEAAHGISFVIFMNSKGDSKALNGDLSSMSHDVFNSLPLRLNATHLCLEDSSWSWFVPILQSVFDDRTLVRFRAHVGSPMECLYYLNSYGISAHESPIDQNGVMDATAFLSDMEEWKVQGELVLNDEEALVDENGSSIVLCPKPVDVLLGRGNPFFSHKGNQRLLELVGRRFDEYDRTESRKEKTRIIKEVICDVHRSGGRFLKQPQDQRPFQEGWIVVDDEQARVKVSHGFRNYRHGRFSADGRS